MIQFSPLIIIPQIIIFQFSSLVYLLPVLNTVIRTFKCCHVLTIIWHYRQTKISFFDSLQLIFSQTLLIIQVMLSANSCLISGVQKPVGTFSNSMETSLWRDFPFLNFLSIVSDLPHTREIETQKDLSIFAKLQSLNDKS